MGGGYSELTGITADLGLSAWGGTVEEAFLRGGEGLASLLADLSRLETRERREITVRAPSREGLLVNYLNEIIYRAETERFYPRCVSSLVLGEGFLTAVLEGETFDPSRHTLIHGVKAATYHGLSISEEPGRVEIRVIFDV